MNPPQPGYFKEGANNQPRVVSGADQATPLADLLRADVKSLAEELKEQCECIQIGKHGTNIPVAICDWNSIQTLAPNIWLNDNLINAVPGLMAATVDPWTFLLSSFLYTGHVKNGDFDGVTRWVQGLPRVRSRWVFGICEAAHWVAIEMNWECSSIRYYDPRPQKASVRRSESLAQHVQAWANDLCRADIDHSRVWELRQLQGPSSNAGDESNCGVYVCWLLRALMQGTSVTKESHLDPLEFRREILQVMRDSPRHPAKTVDDGEGGDSDDLVIVCQKSKPVPTNKNPRKGDAEAKEKDMVSMPCSMTIMDHEKREPGQTASSNSLQNPDGAADQLDFPTYQTSAPGESPNFGFQDESNSEKGGFNLHELQDDAWNAMHDDIGLNNMHLATDNQKLTPTSDIRAQNHPTNVENMIEQDFDFIFNLEDDHRRSSSEAGLQGETEQGHDSPCVAANVQDIMQQDINYGFSALDVQEIIQHDYGFLLDTREDMDESF